MRTLKEKFEAKFTVASSGCWIWLGATTGSTGKRPCMRVEGHTRYASRIAWELYKGPFPYVGYLCHTCDTILCVNPSHMFLGSQQENMQDASRKGRFCGKVVINETLVISIRKLRAEGLTQQAIAYITQVPRGTISNILRGSRWDNV